jgi:NADH:ubiquinone oxidoreductase subunit
MGVLNILGALSPVHMWWLQFTSGAKLIGCDMLGNRYFESKPRPGTKKNRRFVMYKGEVESTRVPPEWHGWLHYQTDVVPQDHGTSFRKPWQQPPQANQTGTAQAWRPPGHILETGKRPKATGDYEAWTPPQ